MVRPDFNLDPSTFLSRFSRLASSFLSGDVDPSDAVDSDDAVAPSFD